MSQYLDAAKPMKGIGKPEKICLAAMAIAVFVYLYWHGAVEYLEKRNTDPTRVDQRSYMGYAINIYKAIHKGKDYYGDGARMPLYPFLQSLLYEPSLSDEAYFVRGKYFNVVLSLLLLIGILFIFKRYFSWPYTVNLTLITAFTVFIFWAAGFHESLLSHFLNFCTFLLMCKMLDSPSWKLGIATGVMLGVAHLTKDSVRLGLGLFLVFSLVKVAYLLYLKLAGRLSVFLASKSDTRALLYRALSVGLVVAGFLGTVYPFISTTKKHFGRYFYNVSTTFYMWYDSWEEVKQGTKAYGDRKGWPDMPPDQIPSLDKYLREHTARQIVERMLNGLGTLNRCSANSYGYYKYVLICFVFFLGVVVLDFRHNLKLAAQHPFTLFFCSSYFVVYLLGYAWYTPIASGNRLILALFLPFMFSVSYVICAQPPRYLQIWRPRGIRIGLLDVLNVSILFILIIDIYFILTRRLLAM